MTALPALQAVGACLRRLWLAARIRWCRARLAQLEVLAASIALQPYTGSPTHLAWLMAQAAVLRLEITLLHQRREQT